ncbi:hypothetical protein FIA58_009315 [Flavobacterium jejuense]|uniref:Uncharacterized protein n=1 Tax=Flavobacterium jejuense TaxID=1544455 RepID=A0ABX0ISR6_9FLAO|nr:hypothetical protein [Flavobacterium jejuense]NHN25872.1 hypothetical protein [Flavobacterium jejuense]
MNKVIAFLLITIFLCANTSIGQLLKIPNLIEHYNEHKSEVVNQSASFINFIKDHYLKKTENNQKEHQDLPFKTFNSSVNLLFTFSFVTFQLLEERFFFDVNKTFFYKKSFKSNLFTSIWLPPKIS